jgi:hypothetical protein
MGQQAQMVVELERSWYDTIRASSSQHTARARSIAARERTHQREETQSNLLAIRVRQRIGGLDSSAGPVEGRTNCQEWPDSWACHFQSAISAPWTIGLIDGLITSGAGREKFPDYDPQGPGRRKTPGRASVLHVKDEQSFIENKQRRTFVLCWIGPIGGRLPLTCRGRLLNTICTLVDSPDDCLSAAEAGTDRLIFSQPNIIRSSSVSQNAPKCA